MNKIYVLQKDTLLPSGGLVPAGTKFINSEHTNFYVSLGQAGWAYSKEVVENDDGTWFKLKEEPKPTVVAQFNSYTNEIGFIVHGQDGEFEIKISRERLAEILLKYHDFKTLIRP